MFRNLFRWGLHIAAVLSLLLFIATAALWIWSYPAFEHVMSPQGSSIEVARGEIICRYYEIRTAFAADHWQWKHVWIRWNADWPDDGVKVIHAYYFNGFWAIIIRLWTPTLLFSILPLLWLWLYHRRRRTLSLPGHCRNCGYDLRASTNTCPECGTPIPPPVTAPS